MSVHAKFRTDLPPVERFDFLKYEFIEGSTSELTLRIAHYIPNGCKRVVVFSNGRNEWIEKYPKLFAELNLDPEVGFLVFDHRGQGRSEGSRANIGSYHQYAEDLRKVINYKVPKHIPYSVVCHSMGGLIALFAAVHQYIFPQKIILNSPLLMLPDKPLPQPLAQPIAKFIVALGGSGFSTLADKHQHIPFAINKLTHSQETYTRIMASPFRGFGARFGWVHATFEALNSIYSQDGVGKLNSEIFMQYGTDERVVSPVGFDLWPDALKQQGKNVIVHSLEDARHELLSEADEYRLIVMNNIRCWLGADYCTLDSQTITS